MACRGPELQYWHNFRMSGMHFNICSQVCHMVQVTRDRLLRDFPFEEAW